MGQQGQAQGGGRVVKYVSLHHHSCFSYQDGHGTPARHVERAAELGMGTLALTEHGNVSSHVQLEYECGKAGIKPIFGLEAYTAPEPSSPKKFHLTILAMDQTGYSNLNRLVTASWENFYRWPTVDGAMLAKYQDGLIVLSGCSDSLLACSLLGGKSIEPADASWERARLTAEKFKGLLGDRYYLECQIFPELMPRCRDINTAWERMSGELGIPLVATADVHTLRPGQHEIRALLHAAGRGRNTIAQQMSGWEYEVPDYIPLSDASVYERLLATGISKRATQAALRNTGEIADRCNVVLPKAEQFQYPATTAELKW
jgi:DNA polymerase III subunit alpha